MDEDELIPPCRLGVKISPAKEDALLKALNVQPAGRFQTMGEFKRALLVGGDGVEESGTEGSTGTQPEPVQTIPSSMQDQAPAQPIQASDGTQEGGTGQKKEWVSTVVVILSAAITAGMILLILTGLFYIFNSKDEDWGDEKVVVQDLGEDRAEKAETKNDDVTDDIKETKSGNEDGVEDNGRAGNNDCTDDEEMTNAFNLSILGESQEMVMTVDDGSGYRALIITNMDGSGEPVVLENTLFQ